MTNIYGADPRDNSVRLSDTERNEAMNNLARAVGEGRLSIEEFEERSDDVMRANTRGALLPIFADIPAAASNEVKIYSREDVQRAYENSRKPRVATGVVGTLGLSFGGFALVGSGLVASAPGLLVGGAALFFLVPILWVLLYVAKLGPRSWHQPSPRQLERQKQRELQAATAHERAQQKMIESQQWAQRRQQASELTNEALKLARQKLEKWNKK
ncbi:DUF1707 SHOCT-like domain-containing protein [Corynebacterium flavescens]|uniref:DUF1707 SHOCT-like domain-containing protein n=1 Tax=Corynebacterium flavescens TaxID=28028 RepID=UPI003FD03954